MREDHAFIKNPKSRRGLNSTRGDWKKVVLNLEQQSTTAVAAVARGTANALAEALEHSTSRGTSATIGGWLSRLRRL